jgi:hypothetical protein
MGLLVAAVLSISSAVEAVAAETTQTFYAAPSASGTSCTSTKPCTLTTAQEKARGAAATGTQNVIVVLRGGTYSLSSPLTFTAADSGVNGHQVSYQAAAGQRPVLSGGRVISGWAPLAGSSQIWVASAPGLVATRQLYVNDRRASVASAPAATVFGALTSTASGYDTSKTVALAPWTRPDDQPSLVYTGAPFPWSQSRCGISSFAANRLTMADPCFANLQSPGSGFTTDLAAANATAVVENNLALLTQPGQFYADSGAGKVYYIPRSDESLTRATVIAPRLESIVVGTGVANLTLDGLVLTHTGWVPPSADGAVDIQSNVFTASTTSAWRTMPAAAQFSGARGVTVRGSTLQHLGGSGIAFEDGGANNAVIGNVVNDLSGTGIAISSPIAVPEDGDTVVDNYVHHIALDYTGGPAIFAGAVARGTVSHNEVWAVPGTGIAVGWGWGAATAMTQTHVDFNHVHDVNPSGLSDGGSIYLNGANAGPDLNSSVSGNYLSNDPQPYGVLYLEAGASDYQVSHNVVARSGTNWLYMQTKRYGNPAVDNAISDNYADASSSQCMATSDTCSDADTIDASNTWTNNQLDLTSWPQAATDIMSSAGLEAAFASLTGGPVDTNLAWHTASTSSSGDAPGSANDGAAASSWTSAGTAAWWQTDLGVRRTLSELQVLTTQGTALARNLGGARLVVSNSPINARNAGTTACTVAAGGTAFRETLSCAPPAGTWRYVGIVGAPDTGISVAEVRAFGH